jgi:MFS family permease
MSSPVVQRTWQLPTPWPLAKAQRAIVVAGCLAMAYTQLTMSPASIQFARHLGGTGFHIGILGALPTGMLFMQFISALVVNHVRQRRWLWLASSITERVILVPVAIGAWVMPEVSNGFWLWALLGAMAANYGLLHFGSPLWLSWMGDYLPHEGLNRYWGKRHLWMQISAAISLALGAIYLLKSGVDVRPAFATLITVGAVLGLADLVHFFKVEEPPVRHLPELKMREILSAPFKHPDFRSFIVYSSFFNFAAMIGAPFISLFLLDYIGMDLFHVLMLWAWSWIGGAVLSRQLGHWAELHGSRPVLVLCTAFKGINMLALMFTPTDPTIAFWFLIPVFMLDALLNAGIAIASNGFMLKNSPRQNRTMYIAAGTALAGTIGGITSVATGAVLAGIEGWSWSFAGWTFVGYHAIFAFSLAMRTVSIWLAARMREPDTTSAREVLTQLIGATPLRIMRFPLGLYRSEEAEAELEKVVPIVGAAVCEEPITEAVPAQIPAPLVARLPVLETAIVQTRISA